MTKTARIDPWGRALVTGFAMAILAVLFASRADAAAPGEEAEAFIGDLATSGVALLKTGDYTSAEREEEFRRIVQHGFALDWIGRFVIGRHWRSMTSEQQAEYQELFSEWLLKSYANRLGGYGTQNFDIVKSIELDNRYNDVVVNTRVISKDGAPQVAAGWRVRKFGEEYKIIDVIVEGISMVGAQKDEFEAVIRKVGVEGLLETLRSRLAVLLVEAG